jgi:hypothetical protein
MLALSGLALLVTACSTLIGTDQRARLLPQEPGLYASTGDQLVRLNGDPKWETQTWNQRANLGQRVDFVIYHPALTQLSVSEIADTVRLEQVSWVRSQVAADGSVTPVPANTWATSGLESFRVPLEFQLVDLRRDMLVAIPAQPLQPGLYSLQFRTPEGVFNTRLGIGWPAVDRRAYSAATCVDRYQGADSRYKRCAEQQQVSSSAGGGLNLYLVTPQAVASDDGRAMVIQGVIVNESAAAKPVPPLSGYLHRDDGEILRHWQFPAPAPELGPGESIPFRTEVPNPPLGAHSIRVRFVGAEDN